MNAQAATDSLQVELLSKFSSAIDLGQKELPKLTDEYIRMVCAGDLFSSYFALAISGTVFLGLFYFITIRCYSDFKNSIRNDESVEVGIYVFFSICVMIIGYASSCGSIEKIIKINTSPRAYVLEQIIK